MSHAFDIAIIGAGIVGLATAWKLSEQAPDLSLCVLDKEDTIGRHQSSHNSGVIHSGIYYKPGSLKAQNCREGYRELLSFAERHDIPYERCGKVIVAVEEKELPMLDRIFRHGQANGLEGIRRIRPEEVREREPHVSCIAGIWVPQTGIIDYLDVAKTYERLLREKGASILTGNAVREIHLGNKTELITDRQTVTAGLAVNCAGLYADRIGKLTEPEMDVQVIPFRGEYYELKPESTHLVNNLIYPVPNPDFPFLGVHFTRMVKGGIEAGPNAVLAFRREGYNLWDLNLPDLWETLRFPGFRRIAGRYWRTGWAEMKRSYRKASFLRALQRLIPEITTDDIVRGRSGVRAQTCHRDGNLTDDFLITRKKGVVNVWNAPSPAATASLAIGRTIAAQALETLNP